VGTPHAESHLDHTTWVGCANSQFTLWYFLLFLFTDSTQVISFDRC